MRIAVALVLLAGCSPPDNAGLVDFGGHDVAAPRDLRPQRDLVLVADLGEVPDLVAVDDLADVDLVETDLVEDPDLRQGRDLERAPDLGELPDLVRPADLTAPDLAIPADLAVVDLLPPPDLTRAPDLVSLPDLLAVPDLSPAPDLRTICPAYRGDCDGYAQNGCESDLNTDANNCGGCGIVCAAPHAATSCAFSCQIDSCVGTYRDCNHSPVDGCETNTKNDPQNCGGCGNSCAPGAYPHASCTCTNGALLLGACDAGYSNCDGDDFNGCETRGAC